MATSVESLPRADSVQTMDHRLVVPLCIVENMLQGELAPPPRDPESPNMTGKAMCDPRVLSSPTSVLDVVDNISVVNKNPKKKKSKKSKSKLFRVKKKKCEDNENDEARQEALRKEAVRLKRIRDQEDADFAKLRAEEESSPKLDMLVHYPLTLMEEVLGIPVPEPPGNIDEDGDVNPEPPKPIFGDPEAKALDLGRFKEKVHELRLSKMDLRKFVSLNGCFTRLQQKLRDGGVITDETLRQKLHVLCRAIIDGNNLDSSECRDIFSMPTSRNRGWNSNLPSAYRRMNEYSTEIDWKKEIENDPTLPSANTQESMKTKKNWSDVKLLSVVSNYSQKGRDSYHNEFQDEVDESDMLAYDRNDQNLREGVDLLTYCVHDLVPIVQEDDVFANLQAELRKIGAVTNEVLKQGLHFYVRDVRLQKERRKAALRALEEKQMMNEDERHCKAQAAKRQPLLGKKKKFRVRSRR